MWKILDENCNFLLSFELIASIVDIFYGKCAFYNHFPDNKRRVHNKAFQRNSDQYNRSNNSVQEKKLVPWKQVFSILAWLRTSVQCVQPFLF